MEGTLYPASLRLTLVHKPFVATARRYPAAPSLRRCRLECRTLATAASEARCGGASLLLATPKSAPRHSGVAPSVCARCSSSFLA